MWTFWYHVPDENIAFNCNNYIKIIECNSPIEVEYVLAYFTHCNWITKGIFSVTIDDISPRIEDNNSAYTISYVSYWEHNITKEDYATSVFYETVINFVNNTLLINSIDPICIRSTPKINKRCAFNIWIPREVFVNDIRNIIDRVFMNNINKKLFKLRGQNSPYRLASLTSKLQRVEKQFSLLNTKSPTITESMKKRS